MILLITISDRKLNFSKGDVNIGFQGDNLIETRVFELAKLYNDTDLSLMDFKLDMQNGANKNVIDLEKSITDDKIILTWTILESHLINDGIVDIQIRGFNDGTEKWHSDIGQVRIKSSINASKLFPDILPSEFIDMEARVTEVKNIAITQAEIATVKAKDATDVLNDFLAKANNLINIGKVQPEYGLWLQEV